MTYTANPASNVNNTMPGALACEADLDERQAERLMPAGCDQQGRYATRASGPDIEPTETYYDDWLDELLANLQFWAAVAVGVALFAFLFGVIRAAVANT